MFVLVYCDAARQKLRKIGQWRTGSPLIGREIIDKT